VSWEPHAKEGPLPEATGEANSQEIEPQEGEAAVIVCKGVALWRSLRVFAVSVSLCVAGLVSATLTFAAEAPFGIKSFSIQTIERTEERQVEHPGAALTEPVGWELENKPYTFTQAGGHPWAVAITGEFTAKERPIRFSNTPEIRQGEEETIRLFDLNPNEVFPTQDPKNIVETLPAGLLGNPQAVPQCPIALASLAKCPPDTIVGWYQFGIGGLEDQYVGPIADVVPEIGQSAELVFENQTPFVEGQVTAHLVGVENTATKKTEYRVNVISKSTPLVGLFKFEATLWGVPADESHRAMRGRFCKRSEPYGPLQCPPTGSLAGGLPSGIAPAPFWSIGTDCSGGPETAVLHADSWQHPGTVHDGHYVGFSEARATMPAPTGCVHVPFGAGIGLEPDTTLADAPVGLGVNVSVPQSELTGSLATSHLRDAVVTLPEGMSISPGIVDGIQACDERGSQGINFPDGENPEAEFQGEDGELHLAPGKCPDASIVGEAEAITPLLGESLKGHVYLARPLCGGPGQPACTTEDALDGRLYQLYLELGGTGALGNAGINIKAHGYVEANPATGQLTTKFLENPQLPFSELKVKLNGGPRAPIDNPAVCGTARTTADFTPWAAPGISPEGLLVEGIPDAMSSAFFKVEGCATPPGLKPGFTAGTVTANAGQFSPFTLDLSRQDREQFVKGLQVHTPPGLLGVLSNVPLCAEAQANAGTCSQASKIGTTRAASGAGSHPFEVEGDVYLTERYAGSPFGLSIVVHLDVGPFHLGVVVVRARIDVNPVDSTLTVTTDESGSHALPQILFGVPVRLKRVTVNIDRPGFMFNPTSCNAQRVAAVASGSEDAIATVSSPFAVGACKSLAFKPMFTATTSGHTSRALGTSLDAKLAYPAGSMGSEANIASVKVSLPKQLPSYLPTLQKACLAATFAADPGSCPKGSIVGIARARTPLLPVGLSGPVYFVSHGGQEFPSLVVVLQGDGVRVDLTGSTFIDKKTGVTSSTFKTVPDVPVGTFELYLPEGRNAALHANGNLCKAQSKLRMPTEFVAQNGARLKESIKIAVGGCDKGRARGAARKGRRATAAGHGLRGGR
jgi:hypothetical protein